MGIRNFLGSALAAFGLTTAASAIAQNEPVQQVT